MPLSLFSEVDIPQSLGRSAFVLLLFVALYPPDLAWVQALGPAPGVADMFGTFLAGTFTRSMDIIGLAVCGFMTMAGGLEAGGLGGGGDSLNERRTPAGAHYTPRRGGF